MEALNRIKSAARILLRGEDQAGARNDIPPLTAEQVAEVKQFFPMEKFFIYGHARSGTTLLARLICLHPEVHCNWQAHFFTRKPLLKSLVDSPEMEEWLTRRSNRWNNGKDLSPLVMRAAADPEGPDNRTAILAGMHWADMVICAWGTHGAHRGQGAIIANLLRASGKPLHHLGLSKHGHPKHPLYIAYSQAPQLWN